MKPCRPARGSRAASGFACLLGLAAALAGGTGAACQSREVAPPAARDPMAPLGGFEPRPWQFIAAAAPVDADGARLVERRLEALEEAGRLGRAVLTGFRRTPPAERRWVEVVESLGYLDMIGLYRLADAAPGAEGASGWRRFGFRGGRLDDAFLFDVDHPAIGSPLRSVEAAEGRAPLTAEAASAPAGGGPAGAPAAGAAAAGVGADPAGGPSPAAASPPLLAPFGRVRGHLALRPASGRSDLFLVRAAVEVGTGALRWEALQDAFAELCRLFDVAARAPGAASAPGAGAGAAARAPTASGSPQADPAFAAAPAPHAGALQAVRTLWPALEGASADLAAEALRAFPRALPALARFAVPERLVVVRRVALAPPAPPPAPAGAPAEARGPATGGPAAAGSASADARGAAPGEATASAPPAALPPAERAYTEVDLRVRLDRAAFQSAYPRLDAYLEGLEGLLEVRFRLEDEQGREVFLIKVDTIDFRATLETAIADGRILPRDGIRRPVWDAAIDPYTTSARPRWTTDIALHLRGIDLELTGLRVEGVYEAHLGFAGLRAVLATPPTARARGALFGFVPVDVLDLVIPSNIEELAVRFLRTLAASNEGRGAVFETLVLPGALESRVAVRGSLQLEDSGFLGFAMRLFGSRILPAPEVRAEWMALMRELTTAVAEDYERFAAHARAAQQAK